MEQKNARKKTFQDRRFDELILHAKVAIREGNDKIYLYGNEITVAPGETGDLENLMTLILNGKRYSITDCLKDKAALARDGLLGSYNVDWGERETMEVLAREDYERRIAEERAQNRAAREAQHKSRKTAKDARKEAWGIWSDVVWAYNTWNAHPEIRHESFRHDVMSALSILRSADALNGKLNRNLSEVLQKRLLAARIHTRVQLFWEQVCDLAELLYAAEPIHEIEAAPENRRAHLKAVARREAIKRAKQLAEEGHAAATAAAKLTSK